MRAETSYNLAFFYISWVVVLFALIFRVLHYYSSNNGFSKNLKVGDRILILRHPYTRGNFQVVKSEHATLIIEIFPQYTIGDCLELKKILNRSNDTFRVLVTSNKDCSSRFLKYIGGIRDSLIGNYQKRLKSPVSGLVLGIIIGYKADFSDYLDNLIKHAGISHILVVSGYNFTLIGKALQKLFSSFKILGIFITLILLGFYLIISGFEIPAIRAILLILFSMGIKQTGHYYWGIYYLIVLSIFFIILDPPIIVDLSFQLSFIATYALLIGSAFNKFPELLGLLFLYIFMVPIQLFYFGTFNLLSILNNFLILPVVPLITLLGLFSLVFDNPLLLLTVRSITIWILYIIENLQVNTFVIHANPSALPVMTYYVLIHGVIFLVFIIYAKYRRNHS